MDCESEGKKKREEREKEIGMLRKGQCMEVSFQKKKKKCQRIERAEGCCAHVNSLFYGFDVHIWRGRTGTGDS